MVTLDTQPDPGEYARGRLDVAGAGGAGVGVVWV